MYCFAIDNHPCFWQDIASLFDVFQVYDLLVHESKGRWFKLHLLQNGYKCKFENDYQIVAEIL